MNLEEQKELERFKADEQIRVEEHKMLMTETFRSSGQFALATIRAAFLMNGGAIIAIVAVVGAAWKGDGDAAAILAGKLTWSLAFWTAGLLASGLSSAAGYFSQEAQRWQIPSNMKWYWRFTASAILTTTLSGAAFIIGSWLALGAFSY